MYNGRPQPRREAAFTLVEILVAFVLLAVLLGVLYSSLRLGSRTASAVASSATQDQEFALTQELLRRSLENAMAVPLVESDDSYKITFDGESSRIRYISEIVGPDGKLRPYVFELAFNSWDSVVAVSYMSAEPIKATWDQQLSEQIVIADDATTLSIEYFDMTEENQGVWVSSWRNRQRMPLLVKLKLAGRSYKWPEIVVQPKIVVDTRNIDETV